MNILQFARPRRLRLLVADVERERPVGVIVISEVTAAGPKREAWVKRLSLPVVGRKTVTEVFELTAVGCVPDSGLEPEPMIRKLLVGQHLADEIRQRFGEEPRLLVADEQVIAFQADFAGGAVDLGFGCSQYLEVTRGAARVLWEAAGSPGPVFPRRIRGDSRVARAGLRALGLKVDALRIAGSAPRRVGIYLSAVADEGRMAA